MDIGKFLVKTGSSIAKSILMSEVKGKIKTFINEKRQKTVEDIHAEMKESIGYVTEHFTLNKSQKILYKGSAVFMHEWLMNSPAVTEKITRDEESGHVYIDGVLINSSAKIDLINRYISATGIRLASNASHLEAALKMIDVTDFNASVFKEHFAGWDPNKDESIIDEFFVKCFEDILITDKEYASKLFRKWIIGTVKRAINPGVAFDGCFTIAGPAGTGKTAFFRNLLPEPFDKRTGEILCNIKNTTRFVESIKGKTIACFDELSVLDYQKSGETFKQLLSSQNIDVRLAWAREPRRYALRQGFAATTNKSKFIPDTFFSRRLWAVEVKEGGRLNFDYLFANREDLLREALYYAENDEVTSLTVDEQQEVEKANAVYVK